MAAKGAKKVTKKAVKKTAKKTAAKAVKKTVIKLKRGKDPKAPKRGQSAYMIWFNENRQAIMKAGKFDKADLANISKAAGAQWGTLTDASKKPYQAKAEKDRARYLKEKAKYVPDPAYAGKKKKKKKDKNAPKRGANAFMFFANANRDRVRKAGGFEKRDIAKIGKQIGAEWNALSDAAKVPYQKQAQKDQIRYHAAKAKYDAKNK